MRNFLLFKEDQKSFHGRSKVILAIAAVCAPRAWSRRSFSTALSMALLTASQNENAPAHQKSNKPAELLRAAGLNRKGARLILPLVPLDNEAGLFNADRLLQFYDCFLRRDRPRPTRPRPISATLAGSGTAPPPLKITSSEPLITWVPAVLKLFSWPDWKDTL
jgi:hypothetical protein